MFKSGFGGDSVKGLVSVVLDEIHAYHGFEFASEQIHVPPLSNRMCVFSAQSGDIELLSPPLFLRCNQQGGGESN